MEVVAGQASLKEPLLITLGYSQTQELVRGLGSLREGEVLFARVALQKISYSGLVVLNWVP